MHSRALAETMASASPLVTALVASAVSVPIGRVTPICSGLYSISSARLDAAPVAHSRHSMLV
jgi:hypothetical protein